MTAEQRAAMLRTSVAAALSSYRDLVHPTSGVADLLRKDAETKTELLSYRRILPTTVFDEVIDYCAIATEADNLATSLNDSVASNGASLSASSISVLATLDNNLPAICHEFSETYKNWIATVCECVLAYKSLAGSSHKVADNSDNRAATRSDFF